jgi:hypothetical protein
MEDRSERRGGRREEGGGRREEGGESDIAREKWHSWSFLVFSVDEL